MIKMLVFSAIAMMLFSCQHKPAQPYAKEVKAEANKGGVIALNTKHTDADKQKAQAMMTVNCGTLPVKITSESTVGEEWQMAYECQAPAKPAKVKKAKKSKK